MTLSPGGILPLPTMDHKPEKKKNNRRTASVEQKKRRHIFLIFHRLYPITAFHTGVINSDFKCYKNKMKLGKKCFPLFVFSCVCVCMWCVIVHVCMFMPCLCKCLDLHSLFYMSLRVYICTWVIVCMRVCVHSAYSLCSLPNIKEVSVPSYTHAFSPPLPPLSLCAVPFIVMTMNAPTISEEQSRYQRLNMCM